MRDDLLKLHRLVMESQTREQHSIETLSDASGSIASALAGIVEEAERLQQIMGDLEKALDVAWTRIEEGEE